MKNRKVENLALIFLLLVSSILGITFLSGCSDSFLWYMPDDKDIFLTIGKYWATGESIPYIDLFDHKGPAIFLLNAIGFIIGNGKMYGVAILEIVFLFITELLMYKILRIKYDFKLSLILSILTPFIFLYNFVPGNFTEEYMLPFLLGTFYICLKIQYTKEKTIKPIYSIFIGISIGFALMTRVTNCLSICLIVLITFIKLVLEKKWKTLISNSLYCVIGFLIIVLPFCLYFASKNALYEMWYATLIYNFDYTSNSGLTFDFTIRDLILLIRMTFAGFLAICICTYKTIFTKNKISLFWLVVSIISTGFIFMLNRYANYSLLLFPFLAVFIVELKDVGILSESIKNILISFAVLLFIMSSCVKINKLNSLNNKTNTLNREEYSSLINRIPKNELENHFVAFDPPVDFYLIENIKPSCKYFIFQTWQSSNSSNLRLLELSEFENNSDIHFILTCSSAEMIKDILNEKYALINSNSVYNLYERVE